MLHMLNTVCVVFHTIEDILVKQTHRYVAMLDFVGSFIHLEANVED